MNFSPQAMYLYKGKWTLEVDTILVDTLLRLKQETGWILKEFPSYFLLTAAKEIEEKEEDFPSKKVVAPEAAWERVCKKNPLAGAYFYHEEPHYYKLACLFGMYDIKMEEEKEVIIISESSEDKEDGEPSCYEIGSVCEEVTSPIVKPVVYARRKLFVTDEETVDRESTTEPDIYFIEVAPDGKLRTRIEHGRVLPKAQSLKTQDSRCWPIETGFTRKLLWVELAHRVVATHPEMNARLWVRRD
ncbi:hypothetical protein AAHA92_10538 [Salvia divinorum]|uniref:Uncharacterized protein n=1 Tax=Salvia divinorum TaxID=28513 RepID=A0ABD1HV44_SALDI